MERFAIRVRGIVQGVGFRPYVFGLASRFALRGFVRNETSAVLIEVEGSRQSLDAFRLELEHRPPPLAKIQEVVCRSLEPRGSKTFRIEASQVDVDGLVFISPDVATCEACLAELFDASDRRYRYPFINCTNCGPRLTIVTGAPYDRPRTTMAGFPLCADCQAEYENPHDRRFHAEPIACPVCGPALALLDERGKPLSSADPLADFVAVIQRGGIGAIKGLGGFHLACDATSEPAVARLRQRKHREEKPLAVMLRRPSAVSAYCQLDDAEHELLGSPSRPIVLLRRNDRESNAAQLAASIAPGNPRLGVMLAYTPLHHLLLEALGDLPLVMTSGNRSDEPIAYRDETVADQLAGIADSFLTHNRPIHVRCDDSVVRTVDGRGTPIRRSRGYAPQPVALPSDCSVPLLAVGGQLKNTFALGRDRQAFLSHHLGDLDHFEAYRAFERDIALYERLFAIEPQAIVHDLHPDYASTRYAIERAELAGLRTIPVQHHHAHLASCLAENGLDELAIGVSLDGTGYGTDGAIWGGEFLIGDFAGFRRAAHLRYVGMPGGERAIREPWRMAVSHLLDAGLDLARLEPEFGRKSIEFVERMIDKQINTPATSSMGRLFDAAAALCGVRTTVSYEGQAAIELEWLASGAPASDGYPFDCVPSDNAQPAARVIDTRPILRGLVADLDRGVERAVVARKFHTTLATMIVDVCQRLRVETGIDTVALSGGVFLNALLAGEARTRLETAGFRVFAQHRVPPGDGGLSLGQIAIGARALERSSSASQAHRGGP